MTPFVEGIVVQLMAAGSCEVVTANQIAVTFAPPEGLACKLDDRIRFTGLLDKDSASVLVENVTRNWSVRVAIKSNDVHDLRLPMRHGASRTPTRERLWR
jgi:hypothetical protein